MKENETGMEDFGCDLEPKPIIKKLEEALRQDSVVHLEGYVGSSVEGTLRLYKSLNLESYVEVSKEEVKLVLKFPMTILAAFKSLFRPLLRLSL